MKKVIKVVAAGILIIAFFLMIASIPPLTMYSQTPPPADTLNKDSLRYEMYSTLWHFKKSNDSLESQLPAIQKETKIHNYNLVAFKKNVASMKDRLARYQKLLRETKKETEIVKVEVPVVEQKTYYIFKDEEGRVIGYDSVPPVVKKSFWQRLFKRK